MTRRWEIRTIACPELPDRTAEVLLGWNRQDGESILDSVQCDNPRLADLDNWTCDWSCWEAIEKRTGRKD